MSDRENAAIHLEDRVSPRKVVRPGGKYLLTGAGGSPEKAGSRVSFLTEDFDGNNADKFETYVI